MKKILPKSLACQTIHQTPNPNNFNLLQDQIPEYYVLLALFSLEEKKSLMSKHLFSP